MDGNVEPAVRDPEAELVAFLAGRSAPCPRCGYDLRDIQTARCPECGDPLVLKVGSPRVRFGWLVLAMAPGCFSGVAAVFVLFPIAMSVWRNLPPGQGAPWPVIVGDGFGFLSAGTVVLMYRHRHRIMSWPVAKQIAFAGSVWGVHIAMFVALVLAIAFLK